MSRGRRAGCTVAVLALLGCAAPEEPSAGRIEGVTLPAATLEARREVRAGAAEAVGAAKGKEILFGDLHVHTTFSIDAFMYALPLIGGEGAHPPADACDYARWCAGLDFFSLNDHAEGLTPAMWRESKQTIRACDARAGAPDAPDLVPFLGFEWTQVGQTAADHYGHKNVVFPGITEDEVPSRPISSVVHGREARPPLAAFRAGSAVARAAGLDPYADVVDRLALLAELPSCPPDVDVRDLPGDCLESAETPEVLFRKLDEWGFPSLVIPHGIAWGTHVPASYDLRTQLSRRQHDPARQKLIEIMSGHGNGEEYRPALDQRDALNALSCPAPSADFLPCCWRAGELMRARCGDLSEAACEAKVVEARQLALAAGASAHRVFPDTDVADWLDCDQCRDCFKPASFLRPRFSAQYGAALTAFEEGAEPLRFRFGFIASTDIHNARAGTGFKQTPRRGISDQRGAPDAASAEVVEDWILDLPDEATGPVPYEPNRFRELFDKERNASFLYPGGIVAVHAAGRDRHAIWDALDRREVYGTSGPRMLLWFDVLNGPEGLAPMGAAVGMTETPRFRVRAAGSLEQRPGCPEEIRSGLGAERVASLCMDECFHPGDARHAIDAIEVVRIRPQVAAGEPIAPLIEDPWRRFPCEPDPAGCTVHFDDPDFVASGRDAVYYVRALQAETPAINGATLRTSFDDEGRATAVAPCTASFRSAADDDCLAPVNERAWSSPIYVDQARGGSPRSGS